jgi:hypothetical protein
VEGERGAGLRVEILQLSNLAQAALRRRSRAISAICRFALNPVSHARQAMAANSTTSRCLVISLISNQEPEDALIPEKSERSRSNGNRKSKISARARFLQRGRPGSSFVQSSLEEKLANKRHALIRILVKSKSWPRNLSSRMLEKAKAQIPNDKLPGLGFPTLPRQSLVLPLALSLYRLGA